MRLVKNSWNEGLLEGVLEDSAAIEVLVHGVSFLWIQCGTKTDFFLSLNFFLCLKEEEKKACKINDLQWSFPH